MTKRDLALTLEELEEALPNGLHDARISALKHDYVRGTVTLDVEILVGLPDDPPSERSRHRVGEIHFHHAQFCVVGMVKNERVLGHPSSIWFTYSRTEPGFMAEKMKSKLAPGTISYSLYILDWESFIHIAARAVSFAWSEPDQTALGE